MPWIFCLMLEEMERRRIVARHGLNVASMMLVVAVSADSSPSSLCVRWCEDKGGRGGWFWGLGWGKSWPITPVTGVGEALWCRRDKYSPWLQPLSNSAPVHAVQKYTQCSGNTAEIRLQCRLCAQTLALLLSYSLQLSGAVRGGAICRKRWADEDAPSPCNSFLISLPKHLLKF